MDMTDNRMLSTRLNLKKAECSKRISYARAYFPRANEFKLPGFLEIDACDWQISGFLHRVGEIVCFQPFLRDFLYLVGFL
jgi:hypothetical protein